MTLKDILIKIGIEADEKPLERVEKQLEGIKHAVEFLAATEVVKGVYELTEKFAHFAEELHVASIAAGMTTEEFQKLSLAAQQSNVSQEAMSMSMARLSRQLYEARLGNAEAQQAFMSAGLTQDQIMSFKNGGQALLALSDKFQGMTDAVTKSAVATTLMGRGSYEMIGFLSQGSAKIKEMGLNFEQMGAVLTGGQIEALVSLEHSLMTLFAIVKSLGATIASYLAPSVETAIQEFLGFWKVNRAIIDLEVRKWVWDVTYAMGAAWAVVKFVAQAFLDFAKNHELLVRRAGELLLALGALVSAFLAFGLVIKFVGTALSGFGPVLRGIIWAFNLLRNSELLATAAGFLMEAPVWAIVGAVTALIFIVQSLWTVLRGGSFKDTWLGELLGAAKNGIMKLIMTGVNMSEGGAAVATAGAGVQNLSTFSGMATSSPPPVSGVLSGSGSSSNSSTYQDNSQYNVSIQLPHGANESAVEAKVRETVKQVHDEHARKLKQTLMPERHY